MGRIHLKTLPPERWAQKTRAQVSSSIQLVPLHRGFDWLREEGGQFFWLDQQFDASSDARFSSDQFFTFEGEHHLVDGWRADTEVPLQIGLGRSAAEDAGIGMDEGQILALLGGEARSRGQGIHVT